MKVQKKLLARILIGFGVGVALAVALDNIAVGIGVGVGVGLVFALGYTRQRGNDDQE
jgi:hypothetical protein